jgi:hypothetical protein
MGLKPVLAIRLILLFLALGYSGPSHTHSWTDEMLEAATGWSVTSDDQSRKRIDIDGVSTSLELLGAQFCSGDNPRWCTVVMTFPEQNVPWSTITEAQNREQCGSVHSPILLVWDTMHNTGRMIGLEDEIVRLDAVSDISYGNFMSAEPEVLIKVQVGACDPLTKKGISAERVYVISLPLVEILFSANSKGVNYTRIIPKRFNRTIKPGILDDGTRAMYIVDNKTFEVESVTLRTKKKERLSPIFPDKDRSDVPVPDFLEGRVIDESGQPVEEAKIHYVRALEFPPRGEASFDSGDVLSREDGSFEVPTAISMDLQITEVGYYPLRQQFYTQDFSIYSSPPSRATLITDSTAELILERKVEAVSMWERDSSIICVMEDSQDSYLQGIQFSSYQDPLIVETAKLDANADIVVELVRVPAAAQQVDCPWRVVLRGQNGWKILPASPDVDVLSVRRAPAEGYVAEVAFSNCTLPDVLFVRKEKGSRYGFLYNVKIQKEYSGSLSDYSWRLLLRYRVQAESGSTRSLIPLQY